MLYDMLKIRGFKASDRALWQELELKYGPVISKEPALQMSLQPCNPISQLVMIATYLTCQVS